MNEINARQIEAAKRAGKEYQGRESVKTETPKTEEVKKPVKEED